MKRWINNNRKKRRKGLEQQTIWVLPVLTACSFLANYVQTDRGVFFFYQNNNDLNFAAKISGDFFSLFSSFCLDDWSADRKVTQRREITHSLRSEMNCLQTITGDRWGKGWVNTANQVNPLAFIQLWFIKKGGIQSNV